jgi:hypothetical protein
MVLFNLSEDSESLCELDRNGGYSLFCSAEPEMRNHITVGARDEERVADCTPLVLETQYLQDAHQVRPLDDSQRLRED